MKYIVTNPIIALIIIALLTLVLYLLYSKFNYSEKNIKRLDLWWISAGLIGLISIINTNKTISHKYEILKIKRNIDSKLNNLIDLSNLRSNFPILRRGNNSPNNFDDVNKDNNNLIKWNKKLYRNLKNINKSNILDIEKIDTLKLLSENYKTEYRDIIKLIDEFNSQIQILNNKEKDINISYIWGEILNIIGALSLVFAFSIRYAIVFYQLKKIKN